MLEILQFVFSSFWTWAGTVILLGVIVGGVVGLFQAIHGAQGGPQ